jgi:hypothetical protein
MRTDDLRLRAAALAVLVTGCAAPLARMDPVGAKDHDVRYKNGTPIVASHGARFDVLVAPQGGPTGRYKIESVLRFLVGVRNRSDAPVLVSESNISAKGGGGPARVVSAAEIEDSVLADAALARGMNAVAGAFATMGAAGAGVTTYSGTAGGVPVQGVVYDHGAAARAQREVINDTAANAHAIRAHEDAALQRVATLFQRNTLEPGNTYVGAVVIERNDGVVGDGPSRVTLNVNVGGEVHAFDFDETGPKRARASVPTTARNPSGRCSSTADCDDVGGICYEGVCRR